MESMNGAWLALGVAGAVAAAGAAMGRGGSRNDEEDADDEMGSMAYDSMARIREANKASGGHWFERGAMRFFNTKIEGGPYGGHYFVTSEVGPDGRKAYSVRKADEDGKISTAGDFQSYSTKGAAVTAAKAMGGSANGSPAYRLIGSGSRFKILASPSNVVVATGSKTRMVKMLSELRALSASGSRDLDDEPASGSRAKTSIRNHRVVGRLSGANGDFRVYETHRTFGPDPIYYVGQIVGDGVDMHPYGHNTKAEAIASARRRAGKA